MIKQKLYKNQNELLYHITNKDWIDEYFDLCNFKLITPKEFEIPYLSLEKSDNFINKHILVFNLKLRSYLRKELITSKREFDISDIFSQEIYVEFFSRIKEDFDKNFNDAKKLKNELKDYWQEFWLIFLKLIFFKYIDKVENKIKIEIKQNIENLKNNINVKLDNFEQVQYIYNNFNLKLKFILDIYDDFEKDILDSWSSIYKINQVYSYVLMYKGGKVE